MRTLTGIPLVPGTASGPALRLGSARRADRSTDATAARERIAAARGDAQAELTNGLDAVPDGPARTILRAHLALLGDPMLTAAIDDGLDAGLSAEEAVERAASTLCARFSALADPALKARSADLRDVCDCLVRHLGDGTGACIPTEGRIAYATELSPAEVLQTIAHPPLAFVLETNVQTSHAVILLRALGVPAVIGIDGITTAVYDGDVLLVDGTEGRVILNPTAGALDVAASTRMAPPPQPDRGPARTCDGAAIAVTATTLDAADARRALDAGAEGIGLFRTEWLFLSADRAPSEAVQYEAFRQVAEAAGDRRVTIRTVDLGSDKRPAWLSLPREPNPALGLRGVRLAFVYPEVLETQLRAVFRAFEGRRLRLLLPMVNDVEDVVRMRRLILDCCGQRAFELGVMIETPAAALMAAELADSADFLSVGTNDLTQYVLAADRESPRMVDVYRTLHPAVLRLVHQVADAAERAGITVSVCGETAADPEAAPILLGLGVIELSVPTPLVSQAIATVRQTTLAHARALAEELMALPTAAAVTARLRERRPWSQVLGPRSRVPGYWSRVRPWTRDVGLGTKDKGPRTRYQGPGTRDQGPGTSDQGRRHAVAPCDARQRNGPARQAGNAVHGAGQPVSVGDSCPDGGEDRGRQERDQPDAARSRPRNDADDRGRRRRRTCGRRGARQPG